MKPVIETSLYLILMTYICMISLDFIYMNSNITKMNEVAYYIEDYTELNGEVKPTNEQEITDEFKNKLDDIANKYGCKKITATYYQSTTNFYYYNITLTYDIKSRIFKINKERNRQMLVRIPIRG